MNRTVFGKWLLLSAFAAGAVLMAAPAAFAQEITVSGEVKTGFYTEQETIGDDDPMAKGGATNNDGESGSGTLVRLGFHLAYENMGLRVRFQIEPGVYALGMINPTWNYAFAYGNLFQEQFTVSAGLLGESPWGTGGHRIWSEPEAREYLGANTLSGDPYITSEGLWGVRFEIKPAAVPGLNVGFVLNQPDQVAEAAQDQTFGDVLGESAIGVAYEHDLFAARVGYRFDSKADKNGEGREEGARLVYRLEERFIKNSIDGMQIWLNGDYYGIGSEQFEIQKNVGGQPVNISMGSGEYFINWLYWLWDAPNFTANLDVCFGIHKTYNNPEFAQNGYAPAERQEYQNLEVHPAFYYKFFDNLLQAGLGLGMGMEFGAGKTYKDSAYQFIYIEPLVRLNIGTNAYVAAVYTFTDQYAWFDESEITRRGEKSVKHAVNIRAAYSF